MNYFNAFWVGGLICLIGQILIAKTRLTPARILTGYVVMGIILTAIGVYEPIVEYAGAGATVPLLGFGYSMAKGVENAIAQQGIRGVLTGGLTASSAGVTAAVLCGIIASFLSKPKEK